MANSQTISKDGLSPEVLEYIEGLEGENNTLAEALDAATDQLEKSAQAASNGDDTDEDDITKGLPAEVAEIVKGLVAPLKEENERLSKQISGEQDIRLTAEQISKAATYGFGDNADLGEVLKSVNQHCGEDIYAKLTKALDAAKEQVKVGSAALLTETGSTQAGLPSEDIEKGSALKRATAELTKGGAMTQVDAIRQLTRTNPELFVVQSTEGI